MRQLIVGADGRLSSHAEVKAGSLRGVERADRSALNPRSAPQR